MLDCVRYVFWAKTACLQKKAVSNSLFFANKRQKQAESSTAPYVRDEPLMENRVFGICVMGNRVSGNRVLGNRFMRNLVLGNRVLVSRVWGNRVMGMWNIWGPRYSTYVSPSTYAYAQQRYSIRSNRIWDRSGIWESGMRSDLGSRIVLCVNSPMKSNLLVISIPRRVK